MSIVGLYFGSEPIGTPDAPPAPFVPATAVVALVGVVRLLLVNNTDVKFWCDQRVFHHTADQGTVKPHIVITRESAERPRTMDGTVNYVRGRIQVDVYAPELRQWLPLVKAIANALENHGNDVEAVAAARQQGMQISYLELDDEQDISTQPFEGQQGPAMRGTAMFFSYMITKPATAGGA
jgi:hypothetical protein